MGAAEALVHRQLMPVMAEAGRAERSALLHIHRVQFAFDAAAPEFEKSPQLGIIGREVEFLPDEALQQGGMIGEPVDDFCRRQPISLKLQLKGGHVSPLLVVTSIESNKDAWIFAPEQ